MIKNGATVAMIKNGATVALINNGATVAMIKTGATVALTRNCDCINDRERYTVKCIIYTVYMYSVYITDKEWCNYV